MAFGRSLNSSKIWLLLIADGWLRQIDFLSLILSKNRVLSFEDFLTGFLVRCLVLPLIDVRCCSSFLRLSFFSCFSVFYGVCCTNC